VGVALLWFVFGGTAALFVRRRRVRS